MKKPDISLPHLSRRTVKTTIWLLLVSVVAATAWVMTSPAFTPDPASVTVDPTMASADMPFGVRQGPTEFAAAADDSLSPTEKAATELPAWKWRDDLDLHENLGLFEYFGFAIAPLAGAFASFCFMITGFIWRFLQSILHTGMTADVIRGAAELINNGFTELFDGLMAAGVFWLVILAAGIAMAMALLKARLIRAVQVALGVILPIALLAVLSGAAQGDGTLPTGSPGWLAVKGINITDNIAQNIGGGWVSDESTGAAFANPRSRANPSCATYMQNMHDKYASSTSVASAEEIAQLKADQNLTDLEVESLQSKYNVDSIAMRTVSTLWEDTVYVSFATAQFGTTPQAPRVACRALEARNETPVSEQVILTAPGGYDTELTMSQASGAIPEEALAQLEADLYTDLPVPDKAVFGNPDGEGNYSPRNWAFLGGDERTELTTSLYSFAACQYDPDAGGWVPTPEWDGVEDDDGHQLEDEHDGGWCPYWWSGELFDNEANGGSDATENKQLLVWANGDDVNKDTVNAPGARDFIQGWTGHNTSDRIIASLMALITSAVLLWTLGGLAVGVLFAQFALALMLVLLPATLLFLALPSERKGDGIGAKMMKMTLAMFASKLTLSIVLMLLMTFIRLGYQVVLGVMGTGMMGTIGLSLVPVAAIIALKKILNAMGVGDITKLSGSLGMTTAATLAATGDKSLTQFGRGVQDGIANTGRAAKKYSGASALARGGRQFGAAGAKTALGMNRHLSWSENFMVKGGSYVRRKTAKKKALKDGASEAAIAQAREENMTGAEKLRRGIGEAALMMTGGIGTAAVLARRSKRKKLLGEDLEDDRSAREELGLPVGNLREQGEELEQAEARDRLAAGEQHRKKKRLRREASDSPEAVRAARANFLERQGAQGRLEAFGTENPDEITPGQLQDLVMQEAERTGIDPSQLMVSRAFGTVMPKRGADVQGTAWEGHAAANVRIEQLPGENQEDYADRVAATLMESGLVDARTGDFANVNSLVEIDMNDASVQRQAQVYVRATQAANNGNQELADKLMRQVETELREKFAKREQLVNVTVADATVDHAAIQQMFEARASNLAVAGVALESGNMDLDVNGIAEQMRQSMEVQQRQMANTAAQISAAEDKIREQLRKVQHAMRSGNEIQRVRLLESLSDDVEAFEDLQKEMAASGELLNFYGEAPGMDVHDMVASYEQAQKAVTEKVEADMRSFKRDMEQAWATSERSVYKAVGGMQTTLGQLTAQAENKVREQRRQAEEKLQDSLRELEREVATAQRTQRAEKRTNPAQHQQQAPFS